MQQASFDLSAGFDYLDPATGLAIPWDEPTPAVIEAIRRSPWKVIDTETTGLTPGSEQQNLTPKELKAGADGRLRWRVLNALIPDTSSSRGFRTFSFDMDKHSPAARKSIATAGLTNCVIGHNVGFDLFWMRREGDNYTTPSLVIDTMLTGRALRPDVTLIQARLAQGIEASGSPFAPPEFATSAEFAEQVKKAAEDIFIQGKSGWSLAHLVLALHSKILSKASQGPKNWCAQFLSRENFDYAKDDVINTYEVILTLLGIAGQGHEAKQVKDVLGAYKRLRDSSPGAIVEPFGRLGTIPEVLQLVEPQVLEVVMMRERGMPWSTEKAERFFDIQTAKVATLADEVIALEPTLAPYRASMIAMDQGVKAQFRQAMGEAFERRGLVLDVTTETQAAKIGEKDLRKSKAQNVAEAKPLFDAWIGLNKAKKSANMAKEFTGFALRSSPAGLQDPVEGDAPFALNRINSLLGYGPVTGRLAAAEPNVQQAPRDQDFRDCVQANEGHKVVSSDYSALDMRVGAALAIRAQRRMAEAYRGERTVDEDVLKAIRDVLDGNISLDIAETKEYLATKALKDWNGKRDAISAIPGAKNRYWDIRRELQRAALIARFTRCYAFVQSKAKAAGTPEWSSLRDAFSIPGMDIHTWTTLGMTGKEPAQLFKGLTGEQLVKELKKWKKELGETRMTGKVGNLSLLYAMQVFGLIEKAANTYNIHWTQEEATKVRTDWLAAYVEIDLWHAWTELNPAGMVEIPDMENAGRLTKKNYYASDTLGNRRIYAMSLNAALSYEDQSTGADIMGTVLHRLREEFPQVFSTLVNQIHDECLFEIPTPSVAEYNEIIGRVMTESAEKFTMQFGVHCDAEPLAGDVWLKEEPAPKPKAEQVPEPALAGGRPRP